MSTHSPRTIAGKRYTWRSRTIAGKRYTWRSNHTRKAEAQAFARKLRQSYPSVRVLHNGGLWSVYTYGRQR